MDAESSTLLISFLPLICMSLLMAIPANLLAREKGRNVLLWTVLALVPGVNFACMWFFVGAANLKLERRIDDLVHELKRAQQEKT